MGLLSNIAKSAGNLLYSATGARQSSKDQFKYQTELQKQANEMNVYNAQHKHQWEMEDLAKAGINPVLTANGSGANTSGATAGGATAGTPQGDILGAIQSAVNLANQMKQTDSNIELQKSQANLADTQSAKNINENKWIDPTSKAKIKNINSATAVQDAETRLKAAQKNNAEMDTALKNQQRWKTREEYFNEQKKGTYQELENKYYHINRTANSATAIIKNLLK